MANHGQRVKRARAGQVYVFDPVGWDTFRPAADLQAREFVRVVNLAGCPKANTMGHCHVEARRFTPMGAKWQFVGLICVASLETLTAHGKQIVSTFKQ